jgi:hypothetical protein
MEMDLKVKVAAIKKGLGNGFSVRLDCNNDWYASTDMGLVISGDGFMAGVSGRGETMDDAVNDLWKILTELPEGRYIVIYDKSGRHKLRWDGSAFVEV